MLWLSVSVIKKQSCIGYSKRSKFRPKMRQNAFGGRAPPGPLGELQRSPRPPSRNTGEGCLLLRGREGKGMGKGREADPRPGLEKCKGGNVAYATPLLSCQVPLHYCLSWTALSWPADVVLRALDSRGREFELWPLLTTK